MAQTYPLDRVIRKVLPGTATADSQRLVIVDVKQKAAVPRKPRPWSDVRYYLVSNRGDPAHESRVEIPGIVLADLDERVEVSASLLVSCPPGSEARVAVALSDPADAPNELLERHVAGCLREMGQDDVAGFARRFFADPAAVQRALAEAVERGTGLRVRARLSLDVERDREVVRVEDAHLAVLVRDWDEEQDLAIRADLEVDDARRAEAVLNRARVPELHDVVPREVRAFVRRRVSLAEFPRMGRGAAKQALAAHLDEVLRPYGRRVGALVVQPGDVPSGPPVLSVLEEVNVPCTVREYPTPVTIGNRVLIRVVDLVKYRGEGSPDLRTWLHDTLGRLVPETVFLARYTELLLRFDLWEERIKLAVRDAAERIGCEISQFITRPDLPQRELVKPFVIRAEGAFETRLHDVEARLEVVVTVRIPRLEDIAPLLSTEPDIPRAMEEAVQAVVRARMHTLHPERFYMRFGFADPERHAEETQSVEAELVELVQQRLSGGEFHAEVISTVIKIVETDLIRRFRELQEATPDFAVQVESLGAEQVDFVAGLRVVAVHRDGWQRFRALTGGIEQVTDKVRDQVHTVLHTLPAEQLLYRSEADRSALAALVSRAVLLYAVEQFGLVVQLSNLRRARTGIEDGYHARLLDEWQRDVETGARLQEIAAGAEISEHAGLAAAMERLIKTSAALRGVEGEEEQLARVESEIAGIKARISRERAAHSAQLQSRAVRAAATAPSLPAGGAVDTMGSLDEAVSDAAGVEP